MRRIIITVILVPVSWWFLNFALYPLCEISMIFQSLLQVACWSEPLCELFPVSSGDNLLHHQPSIGAPWAMSAMRIALLLGGLILVSFFALRSSPILYALKAN